MNKERRKEIAALISDIQGIIASIEAVQSRVESVQNDEQEYFDNMPESFQQSEKGMAAENAADNLGSTDDGFESSVAALEDVISYLEYASE